MSTMLAMIREFMDREVISLEGEMLHGDPARVEAGVKAAQAKVKQMGLWAPNHPVELPPRRHRLQTAPRHHRRRLT